MLSGPQIHATALLDLLQHCAVLCLALILTDNNNIIGKEPEDSLLRQHVHVINFIANL